MGMSRHAAKPIAATQTTLRDDVSIAGIGVHSGAPVTLTMRPADAGTGIRFCAQTRSGNSVREIRADVRAVTATEFATVLGDHDGPLCSTAEHVMAALAALGVDNAVIEVDGPEVPIMDGSADAFVAAIDQAGIVTLDARRRYLKVLKPVRVARDGAMGELLSERRRLPAGSRDCIRSSADRPPVLQHRHRCAELPPRTVARTHLRLHEGRFEAVERGLCARRQFRQYAGRQRRPRAQFRRPAVSGRIRPPQDARCAGRPRAWPVRRCWRPIVRCVAATSSITRC